MSDGNLINNVLGLALPSLPMFVIPRSASAAFTILGMRLASLG